MRLWPRASRQKTAAPAEEAAASVAPGQFPERTDSTGDAHAGDVQGELAPHAQRQLSLARVVVLTRPGCHLCEQAELTARRVAREHDATMALLDVDAHPELRDAFTDHVPVTFVDGELLEYWQLDAVRLAAALGGEAVAPPAPLFGTR